MTLRYTNISTDVRCMPIGTARLTSGSELYPNANLDLTRVDWDDSPMNWYLELASNVENVYDADMELNALHRTVECASRCSSWATVFVIGIGSHRIRAVHEWAYLCLPDSQWALHSMRPVPH